MRSPRLSDAWRLPDEESEDEYEDKERVTSELDEEEEEEESESDSDASEENVAPTHPPSPPPRETTLEAAISSTPGHVARSLLVRCRVHSVARKLASAELLRPIAANVNAKRKAYETCVNCDSEYQIDFNEAGVCVYRPGEKEVDDSGDFWADHDDDCHGDPSILIHDDDDGTSQEGTIWSCCDDNDGFHKGCVRTRHVPGQNSSGSKKKTKYGY